jgi:hypothetical protein
LSEEEIFATVDKIYPEFIQLLRQKNPELETLYVMRYSYTDKKYPPTMRLHNAYEILRAYIALKVS